MSSTPSSGISAIAYSNLLRHLGRSDLPVWVYDVVQQLAQPDMSLLDRFGIDVLDIGREFNDQPSDWKPTLLANGAPAFYPVWFNPVKMAEGSWVTFDDDGQRMLSRMPVGATFFDQTYFPYADGYPASYENLSAEMGRIMWARDAHSPWDHAGEPDFWIKLREKALHLRQTTILTQIWQKWLLIRPLSNGGPLWNPCSNLSKTAGKASGGPTWRRCFIWISG